MSIPKFYQLNNGISIPSIGFGTWQTPDGDVAVSSVRSAIEAGYRHIDTAQGYGNEESVGEGIRQGGVAREELFITTKLANHLHTYDLTKESFAESLKKLGLEYLDLFLIHWPNPVKFRDHWEEANAETWKAMEELVDAGLVRSIGISNFRIPDMENLLKHVKIRPHANQISIHIGRTPMDWIEYCKKEDMLVMSYAPNATGILANDKRVCAMAEKYGVSVPQLGSRYNLQLGTLPLPRSKQEAHIKENAALDHFTITDEDMAYLISLVE